MAEKEIYFRDRIATSDDQGRRRWVYAKLPAGRYTTRRNIVAVILLILFFALPHIKIHGEPILLLDILNRHFILFGAIFWPQDTYLLGITMLTLVVFVILFTVIYGRIWCGWACPQTIFMEIVFRRIETMIEGSPTEQKEAKIHKSLKFIFKRLLKYLLFFAIIFLTVNTFISYFIGIDGLEKAWNEAFANNNIALGVLIGGTIAGMFIYTWFREQACTIVCPYGRLQGSLVDNDTLIVAYDYKRGEPRGKNQQGDCIDCKSCVAVCPTGIDIRNGTQLECVNCTACIDACDAVMDRINKPKGLIRYTSEKGIKEGIKLHFTGRMAFYTVVLGALLVFLGFLMFSRTDMETTILRTPGMLYQAQGSDSTSNLYNYKIVNKSRKELNLEIKLVEPSDGIIKMVGNAPIAKPESATEGVFFVILPNNKLTTHQIAVKFHIILDGKIMEEQTASFLTSNTNN